MDNSGTFSSSYSLVKWSSVLLQGVLWCTLVLWLYRWISKYPFKSSPGIPALRIPFYSFYGHLRTLPSSSVMKNTSLTLNAAVLQIQCAHAALFPKEPLYLLAIGFYDFIMLVKSESVEELLTSNVLLEKSQPYALLHPWLGTGLLTSHGTKWKSRRKLLTPSFHFDILKEFLPIFDEQSQVLVGILKKRAHEEWINIINPITLCALDIICETSLGACVGSQTDNESEYAAAVLRASKTLMERMVSPLFKSDKIFFWSKLGRQFRTDLTFLHTFTRKIIEEKKKALKLKENHRQDRQSQEFLDGVKRKRKALMDLLLDIHMNDQSFSEEDLREEIDTFVFEGHDTTSMGMCWALYLIGLYPDVQNLVHEELDVIYRDDPERSVTVDDLREMHYLERVLKESQRLYPSVPFFARTAPKDVKLCGYDIKKGSSICVHTYLLHRNPEVFTNPEKFDPDRFLPENCIGRSPFAYVPFSAGPRNCIGQRFAMMEEKTVISNILRTFHVKSLEHRDKIVPACELILRSELPLKLKFTLRKSSSE